PCCGGRPGSPLWRRPVFRLPFRIPLRVRTGTALQRQRRVPAHSSVHLQSRVTGADLFERVGIGRFLVVDLFLHLGGGDRGQEPHEQQEQRQEQAHAADE